MVKKKEPQLRAGDKVFIINSKLEIEEKKIHGVTFEEDTIKYQLEEHQCGGTEKTQIFKIKAQAEAEKQNFLDNLNYKIGDLIIFNYKEYSHSKIQKKMGRITGLAYNGNSYIIKGSYQEFNNISDEDIFLKVKNEFIENYSNIQELYEEFKEKEKEINRIITLIHREHKKLEDELDISIRKQYSIFHWDKKKPLFKDRFNYERSVCYD